MQQCQSNNSQAITAAQVLGEGSRFSPVAGARSRRSPEARMGKRYQVPEGLYINVSFPTRFAKALKKNAKKAVTLRGDACAMCLSCPGLVVVLSCCRVAVLLRC